MKAHHRYPSWLCLALLAPLATACSGGEARQPQPQQEEARARSGGDTTTFSVGRLAFSKAAENLSGEREAQFFDGNSLFNRNWVTAPASTSAIDGLGPTF